MKDITSTSFGIVISFLLPGLAGLLAIAYWHDSTRSLLRGAVQPGSSMGQILMVLLAALTLGLMISAVRTLVITRLFCGSLKFGEGLFRQLENETKRRAFRVFVDEQYRYAQFRGGMAVVLPALYFGWGWQLYWLSWPARLLSGVVWLGVEIIMVWGARGAYKSYVTRGTEILGGTD